MSVYLYPLILKSGTIILVKKPNLKAGGFSQRSGWVDQVSETAEKECLVCIRSG